VVELELVVAFMEGLAAVEGLEAEEEEASAVALALD
jgi:hypothetical protein